MERCRFPHVHSKGDGETGTIPYIPAESTVSGNHIPQSPLFEQKVEEEVEKLCTLAFGG